MTSTPPPQSDANSRCVLLVGGGAVPSNLVAALGQRGIRAVIARAAPEVMAELADGGVASVVVVEPDRQDRADELHAAAARYHPGVRFWTYAPQAPGREARLSVFTPGPHATEPPAPGAPPSGENAGSGANPWYPPAYSGQNANSAATPEPDATPGSPIPAERGADAGTGTHRRVKPADDDQALVSEQELAMLLGIDSSPSPEAVPERVTGSIRGHGRENGRE